jgi:hypothetical protein
VPASWAAIAIDGATIKNAARASFRSVLLIVLLLVVLVLLQK